MWLFTNAYINHGKRVVKLLGVDDLFEGITYCDYGARKFTCKPNTEMFEQAQRDAKVTNVKNCYFIGESTPDGAISYADFNQTIPRSIAVRPKNSAGRQSTTWSLQTIPLQSQRLNTIFRACIN